MDAMCLALLAWKTTPGYRLVAANNRDEFHWRKTEPIHRWPDSDIVAGRDAVGGGTWLGVTKSGRTGLITNIRNGMPLPSRGQSKATTYLSRGLLVSDYLAADQTPGQFVEDLAATAHYYQPFNLVVGDRDTLIWATNWRTFRSVEMAPGIYGLSNAELDSDWPKVRTGKHEFTDALNQSTDRTRTSELLDVLADRSRPDDEDLPSTNVPHLVERMVGPRFVQGGIYGTRASTVVTIPESGQPRITERRFTWFGKPAGESTIIA